MDIIKKIFGKGISRAWAITTAALLIFFIVLNSVAFTLLSTVLDSVFGTKRAVYASGIKPVYETETKSKAEALEKANKFNETICEEGFVLLKNDNGALPIKTKKSAVAPATAEPKISVFGKNSVNIALGGSGSGGGGGASGAKSLYDSLHEAGYLTNDTLEAFYNNDSASGTKRPAKPDSNLDDGKTISIATYETPITNYTDTVKSSYANYSDAAIVVFTRMGGEGFDLPRTMAGDENSHYLELDANEKAMLKSVCEQNFKHVIVLLNVGTTMELGFLSDPAYNGKIDACIWMGFPGTTGVMALGRILNGNVNPSGRSTDTYVKDFTADPTWFNFGDNGVVGNAKEQKPDGNQYVNKANNGLESYYSVDYEEGIYSGYRYYETRGVYEAKKNRNPDWYSDNVVYSFGHGLSYSTFEWTIKDDSAIKNKDISLDEAGKKYTITVSVTNTSAVAGKDVVELYGHAPVDANDPIEKSHVVLLDFAKTELIPAGGTKDVTLTFDPYYLASYDADDKNGDNDDKGRFELEVVNGDDAYDKDYKLILGKNAHDSTLEIPFEVSETIGYDKDPVTGYKVENRFTGNKNAYLNSVLNGMKILNRLKWENFPSRPTVEERTVEAGFIAALADIKTNNPEKLKRLEMPKYDESSKLKLRDLITDKDGKYVTPDYADPRWKELLDKCTPAELLAMVDYGAFKSDGIMKIGKNPTNDTDGPAGFVNFMLKDGTYYDTCYYACQMVVASSWSKEIAEGFGKSVGEEGIWGADGKGNRLNYSGWYAPGMNIHRSPFGGRNFEYMSEDPVLTGKMAAAQIMGCQSKGVYCFMKHFAVNEQETRRSIGGLVTSIDEQTLREVYLRPFEIAVKEGKATGVMSSFTRIGTRWAGGDYRLLTQILRNEWGFNGMVVTDFNSGSYMNPRQMYYAGGNLNLNNQEAYAWKDFKATSPADAEIIRRAAKGVLYAVANSNSMNREVSGYGLSLWATLLIVLDVVVFVALAAWGTFALLAVFKPDLALFKRKNAPVAKTSDSAVAKDE